MSVIVWFKIKLNNQYHCKPIKSKIAQTISVSMWLFQIFFLLSFKLICFFEFLCFFFLFCLIVYCLICNTLIHTHTHRYCQLAVDPISIKMLRRTRFSRQNSVHNFRCVSATESQSN